MKNRAFPMIPLNQREGKPRTKGITEIRGPYYSVMGKRYLADVLETMGEYVDILKFARGSFSLMPKKAISEIIELCHENQVQVSTGGFVEHVLTLGPKAVKEYLKECKKMGFDIVEISAGFLTIPQEDLVRLTKEVLDLELKPKPEVGIQFGAGGATTPEELESEGTKDVGAAISLAKAHLAAGAKLIMIESEGITECVTKWRTDVATRIASELGLENIMFEAADPEVFAWYIKQYGPEVNLFVDHSQIVQLETLRSGIWGLGGILETTLVVRVASCSATKEGERLGRGTRSNRGFSITNWRSSMRR